MPIYEYVCEKCGDHVEVLQKVSDPPPKRCKKCRGKLERIVSRTAFQLKGSGWYKTDYAGKPAPKAEKALKRAPTRNLNQVNLNQVNLKPDRLLQPLAARPQRINRAGQSQVHLLLSIQFFLE